MPKPTADDVISLLEQLIKLLGPDALTLADWTQFYSGPRKDILAKLFGHTAAKITAAEKNRSNHNKAIRQAAHYSAVLIDDTVPSKLLGSINIYQFFDLAYAPDPFAGAVEANKVDRFLSREFARAAKGHIITAVCGADKRRIFRDTEFPELLDNKEVFTINGVAREIIREIYYSTPASPEEGYDKAYRLVCITELRISARRAWKEATKEAVRNHIDRRSFYQIDRRDELVSAGKPIPKIFVLTQRERRARNAAFRTKILGTVKISAMPRRSARRPKVAGMHSVI